MRKISILELRRNILGVRHPEMFIRVGEATVRHFGLVQTARRPPIATAWLNLSASELHAGGMQPNDFFHQWLQFH